MVFFLLFFSLHSVGWLCGTLSVEDHPLLFMAFSNYLHMELSDHISGLYYISTSYNILENMRHLTAQYMEDWCVIKLRVKAGFFNRPGIALGNIFKDFIFLSSV